MEFITCDMDGLIADNLDIAWWRFRLDNSTLALIPASSTIDPIPNQSATAWEVTVKVDTSP